MRGGRPIIHISPIVTHAPRPGIQRATILSLEGGTVHRIDRRRRKISLRLQEFACYKSIEAAREIIGVGDEPGDHVFEGAVCKAAVAGKIEEGGDVVHEEAEAGLEEDGLVVVGDSDVIDFDDLGVVRDIAPNGARDRRSGGEGGVP